MDQFSTSCGDRIIHTLYQSYDAWKGWGTPFTCPEELQRYFAGECEGAVIAGGNVLELGFGSGTFLAWAHGQGANVYGTEINPAFIEFGETFGVTILAPAIEDHADTYRGHFHTVVAFDVFEHFALSEIADRLRAIETMLSPGGHLIMRFPNAQSPFGLAPQFGDATHKSALSRSIIEQLVQTMNLEVVRYGPSFRVAGSGLGNRIGRRVRWLMRDAVSGLLNAIYVQNIPWDPVVTLVLQKPAQDTAA
ncbi:MAG: class I SAM-dependent methyltransferase [Rhizobiales bacterium]|nr:class I SAM-dependent methyltransferase [Hyphomicrobiales bacterium]